LFREEDVMLGNTKRQLLAAVAGVASLMVGAQAARAAVIIYSDADAFKVAAGPIKAFASDGDVAHGLGVNAGSFVTPEALFRDSFNAGSGVIDFHFAGGTTAFGGGFDRLPGSNFSNELKVTLVFADGTREVLDPMAYKQNGFFGLTAGKVFTDVIFENIAGSGGGGGGGGGGGFSGRLNFSDFAPPPPPASQIAGSDVVNAVFNRGVGDDLRAALVIPEPTTWAMMIGGLFGAGALLRQRRRQVPLA
jgi:hypothetical protein